MRPSRSTGIVASLFLIWLVVVSAGLAGLWAYSETPGPDATPSPGWPGMTHLQRDVHRPTLVVFAHPQCACSRATIGELALLMTHAQGRVTTKVLFYRPSGAADEWAHTDLWQSAAAIPGVDVEIDSNGDEAAIFGAVVSGQTLLYDAGGRLVFNGGITFARGHSGDNAGRTALASLLANGSARTTKTPVFGCFLRDAVEMSRAIAAAQRKS